MPDPALPIRALISHRCKEIGLTTTDLVRRCGYRNLNKGCRRLQDLLRGRFRGTEGLVKALPGALGLSRESILEAVEETKRQLLAKEEAGWRAAFRPHAIVLVKENHPQPSFVEAFLSHLRWIDLDASQAPVSFIGQALDTLRERLAQGGSDRLAAFGHPLGVAVNFEPDRAVVFDLEGKPIEVLDRAYRLGTIQLSLRRRPISEPELRALFSSGGG